MTHRHRPIREKASRSSFKVPIRFADLDKVFKPYVFKARPVTSVPAELRSRTRVASSGGLHVLVGYPLEQVMHGFTWFDHRQSGGPSGCSEQHPDHFWTPYAKDFHEGRRICLGQNEGSIPFTRFKPFSIRLLRGHSGDLNSSFRAVFHNKFKTVPGCSLA